MQNYIEAKQTLFQQFLVHGSQRNTVETTDMLLDHPALSLLMKHKIKDFYKKENCFLLAGTEDLRVLLNFLDLSSENAEAFIWLRPYIHSIGLYLFREEGKLQAYFFDPQAWGERYYPNRLIIAALANQYPHIDIYEFSIPIQSQSNDQVHCHAHIFNFFDSIAKLGKQVVKDIILENEAGSAYNYEVGNKDRFAVIRLQSSQTTSMSQIHEFDFDKIHQLRVKLRDENLKEEIFPNYIIEDKVTQSPSINWDKIWLVVEEMQGTGICHYDSLTPEHPLLFNPLLQNQNADRKYELLFPFASKDHFLYSNFLTFKNALYPKENALEDTVFGPALSVEKLQESGNYFLQVTSSDRTKLLYACQQMQENLQTYFFSKQMRQTLALRIFTAELKQVVHLQEIVENNQNGLQINEACAALCYLSKDQSNVQVTSQYYNQAEQDQIILMQLDLSKQYILIPYAVKNTHAILIAIDTSTKNISIYDSQSPSYQVNDLSIMKKLMDLMQGYTLEPNVLSHYKTQGDDSACVLYVIQHGLNIVGNTIPAEANELDLSKILIPFYRASLLGKRDSISISVTLDKNVTQKRLLLEAIEAIRFDKGFFNNQEQLPEDLLKPLADELQRELWGNLDRCKTPFDNPGRLMQQDHFIRNRFLKEFFEDAIKKFSGTETAYWLEQIKWLPFYENGSSEGLQEYIQQLLIEASVDKEVRSRVLIPMIELAVQGIETPSNADEITAAGFLAEMEEDCKKRKIDGDVLRSMFERVKKQRLLELQKSQESEALQVPMRIEKTSAPSQSFFDIQRRSKEARISRIMANYPGFSSEIYDYFAGEGYDFYFELQEAKIKSEELKKFDENVIFIIGKTLTDTKNNDEDDNPENFNRLVRFFFDPSITEKDVAGEANNNWWSSVQNFEEVIPLILKYKPFFFYKLPEVFLEAAADSDSNECVVMLVEKLIAWNLVTVNVIIIALKENIESFFEAVIKKNPELLNQDLGEGCGSMFHLLIERGSREVLQFLLTNKAKLPFANLNSCNGEGLNALEYAVCKSLWVGKQAGDNRPSVVQILKNHGAQLSNTSKANAQIFSLLKKYPHVLSVADLAGFDYVNYKEQGQTLFAHYIKIQGKIQRFSEIETLIAKGAHKVPCDGETSYVDLAFCFGNFALANSLLQAGIGFNKNSPAAVRATLENVWPDRKLLQTFGIDIVNLRDGNGNSALHYAVQWHKKAPNVYKPWILELIEFYRFDINVENNTGISPIDIAFILRDIELVKFFLDKKAVLDMSKSCYKGVFFNAIKSLDLFQLKVLDSLRFDFSITDDHTNNAFYYLLNNWESSKIAIEVTKFLLSRNVYLSKISVEEGRGVVDKSSITKIFTSHLSENTSLIRSVIAGMLIRTLLCPVEDIPSSLEEVKEFISTFMKTSYASGLTLAKQDLEFFKEPILSIASDSLLTDHLEAIQDKWHCLESLKDGLANLYKRMSQLCNILPENDNVSMFAKTQEPSSTQGHVAIEEKVSQKVDI